MAASVDRDGVRRIDPTSSQVSAVERKTVRVQANEKGIVKAGIRGLESIENREIRRRSVPAHIGRSDAAHHDPGWPVTAAASVISTVQKSVAGPTQFWYKSVRASPRNNLA